MFNPTSQGKKFDPSGAYVRRYVPELAGIAGGGVHDPSAGGDVPVGYVAPMVDHAEERLEALARYDEGRG